MKIAVTAKRWRGGWELWGENEPWTQSATLARAEEQVRDYLDTVYPNVDHSRWTITIEPELGEIGREVATARQATAAATAASLEAAKQSRAVAKRLREEGFSVTDSAVILGVSRGRVSQLVS